jgi:hypothetical protein
MSELVRLAIVMIVCGIVSSAGAQLLTTMAGGVAGGSGPGSCAGVIDLSLGCMIPGVGP